MNNRSVRKSSPPRQPSRRVNDIELASNTPTDAEAVWDRYWAAVGAGDAGAAEILRELIEQKGPNE